MKFKPETLTALQELYRKFEFGKDQGSAEDFSDNLDSVLSRLASIMVVEFELETSGYTDDKLMKFLEIAATAAKSL